MDRKKVFSICGMCTVRCPIQAEVEDGRAVSLIGNPHAPGIQGSICARGAAGLALSYDVERPQSPLIRVGERGEGKWRPVSWDEAFDYVAEKINAAREKYGDRTLLFSDRGGPFRDYPRALLRGLGTPNYCNHDASCARNVQHAALSLFGFGRKDVVYDLKNAKHVVLQTRNIFESINVKEVNDLLDAMDNGCKLTVIDIRATVTATKAHRVFLIRPGTDYAFNLGVLHAIVTEKLYDREFVDMWVKDFDALVAFLKPYTPEWAAAETGTDAGDIRAFARELAEAAPAVIWHPGWMVARYSDSFAVSRSAYLVNTLLGSIGSKGGLPQGLKPGEVGRKGLKSFMELYPKPAEKRADGVGWKYPQLEAGPGLLHLAFEAVKTGDPYPVKAYIAWRHDPLMAFPDPAEQKAILDNLDLLVSVTFTWSDTAWYSDVVLPLSPYLERESIIITKAGLKPSFAVRQRAVDPVFDTKADWEIVSGLAKRFGLTELVYEKVEDLWNFQLEGTGVKIEDFDKTGSVSLADQAFYRPRAELKFKTPSKKVEIVNELWDKADCPSLAPYVSPAHPPAGSFRVTFGRIGVHTQGHTVNNPLLNEQMPENVLWINEAVAEKLGIASGDTVEIGTDGNKGTMKAFVTAFIHPEAVFMVHGFGHTLPVESRAKGKGVADQELMPGGLANWDKSGGGLCLQEHFVTVRKA